MSAATSDATGKKWISPPDRTPWPAWRPRLDRLDRCSAARGSLAPQFRPLSSLVTCLYASFSYPNYHYIVQMPPSRTQYPCNRCSLFSLRILRIKEGANLPVCGLALQALVRWAWAALTRSRTAAHKSPACTSSPNGYIAAFNWRRRKRVITDLASSWESTSVHIIPLVSGATLLSSCGLPVP